MRCITSTIFSVLNGVPKWFITPQKGLRQGCPLSPYLFIMCAEVFSSLMLHAEEQNLIHGLRFGSTITISHLLFTDESLIFMRAAVADCQSMKAIFDYYTNALGQPFNVDKSSNSLMEIPKWRMWPQSKEFLTLVSFLGTRNTWGNHLW